jgi:hypothetical protein
MESVEMVEEDEDDPDVEWRDEDNDDKLLLERERKAVFERLKHWLEHFKIERIVSHFGMDDFVWLCLRLIGEGETERGAVERDFARLCLFVLLYLMSIEVGA